MPDCLSVFLTDRQTDKQNERISTLRTERTRFVSTLSKKKKNKQINKKEKKTRTRSSEYILPGDPISSLSIQAPFLYDFFVVCSNCKLIRCPGFSPPGKNGGSMPT